MCCECCSVTQRKVWVFGLGTFLFACGTIILLIWSDIALKILHNNLVLQEGTEGYKNWVEAPIPIYLKFYLFNWTNPHEIRDPNVKPNFVEMGPYVFLEKHLKENITFYNNDTVSYFEKRTWFFDADRSNGSLDDIVTTAHVITAAVADETRQQNEIIKKIINFMLNHEGGKLFVAKPVRDWIFDGFQDELIDFLKLFNTTKIDLPYKRFGWLVDRNASAEYDGLFTINTGVKEIANLGRLTHWNGRNETGFYESPCGTVNGSTGDLFPPHMDPKAEMTIFATDACRYLNLVPNGHVQRHGLSAIEWTGTNETLDSGENYAAQKCFCDARYETCPKTGVVECKKCRQNSPIYASFPHFYLADPSYLEPITGLKPMANKHEFAIAVEPMSGIPLTVNARLQINMMIEPDSTFEIFRGIPKFLMPMFWFEQKAELSEELASRTKLAINLGSYGNYLAIALITLGGIFYITGIVLTLTKRWKREPRDDEDMLAS